MSITLKIAAATTLVVTRAREIINGFAFQKLGTSFSDATLLNVTQRENKVGTARTRWSVKRPYTYVDSQGVTRSSYMLVSIETSIEKSCPLTVADEIPHLVQSIGAEPQFLAHVKERIQPN